MKVFGVVIFERQYSDAWDNILGLAVVLFVFGVVASIPYSWYIIIVSGAFTNLYFVMIASILAVLNVGLFMKKAHKRSILILNIVAFIFSLGLCQLLIETYPVNFYTQTLIVTVIVLLITFLDAYYKAFLNIEVMGFFTVLSCCLGFSNLVLSLLALYGKSGTINLLDILVATLSSAFGAIMISMLPSLLVYLVFSAVDKLHKKDSITL